MNAREKFAYIQDNHFGEWVKKRQEVEDYLSERQDMFCVCGRLATGLHERSCRKFQKKVNDETIKRLNYLLPQKKRPRINPIGKRGRANAAARRKIAEVGAEMNITECEVKLEGCMRTFGLAPAHRHKRDWYKGDAEKLADPSEWVGACQHCHDLIEHNKVLTEQVFNKLRPQEMYVFQR